jgi:hypothetical protein
MGNLVSSCGSPASSPSSPTPKNNSKNTIPKTNTPPPPGPSPAPTNSKANANANKNTSSAPKKGVRFGNTNTRSIKNINAQMKNTNAPNLTKTPEKSALSPVEEQSNIQTNNPRANTVLEKSIKKAIKPSRLAKPVAQGMTNPTTPENREALLKNEENEENEATIIGMTTNTNPKPANEGYRTLGTKPVPGGPSMVGGRRRKTRKQRKHRK